MTNSAERKVESTARANWGSRSLQGTMGLSARATFAGPSQLDSDELLATESEPASLDSVLVAEGEPSLDDLFEASRAVRHAPDLECERGQQAVMARLAAAGVLRPATKK